MPRALNPALATFMSNQDVGTDPTNRNFRITHVEDVIPNSLFKTVFFTFSQHITPSYLITTNDTAKPTANTTEVILTDVDVPVANPFDVDADLAAHSFYFNNILSCGPAIEPAATLALYEVEMGFIPSPF
jgi:hypothetical protein